MSGIAPFGGSGYQVGQYIGPALEIGIASSFVKDPMKEAVTSVMAAKATEIADMGLASKAKAMVDVITHIVQLESAVPRVNPMIVIPLKATLFAMVPKDAETQAYFKQLLEEAKKATAGMPVPLGLTAGP